MNTTPFTNPNDTYLDGLLVATDDRLVFKDPDTSLAKNVYNQAGTPLGNKISLTATGQANPQLFLGEGKYSVMLQRYVAGDRNLDASWADAWPISYIANGANATGESAGSFGVFATRANVKALAIGHGYDAVLCLGYYTSTDGGGGLFTWSASSAVADDFGYQINLDSAPGTGRFLWAKQAGQKSVSTASYGVTTQITGSCDTRVLNAMNMAIALGYTLDLNSCAHSFSGGFMFTVQTSVPSGCRFTAPDATTVRSILFTKQTTIDQRVASNPFNVATRVSVSFAMRCVEGGVRPEWWDGGYVSGSITANQISQASINGMGYTRLTNGLDYDASLGEIYGAVIVEYGATISQNTDGIVCIIEGPLIVDSPAAWRIVKNSTTGYITFGDGQVEPVEAWWFGWGNTNTLTQAQCLNAAYLSCIGYSKVLHIKKSLLAYKIDANIPFTARNVHVDIDDSLNIGTGIVTLTNVTNDRRTLFTFGTGGDGSHIITKGGVVYPEWFGAAGDGTNDDITALTNSILCANASRQLPAKTFIDLGGKLYYIGTSLTMSNIFYIGIRNGQIKQSNLNLTNWAYVDFNDVTITSEITGNALSLTSCSNINLNNVSVSSNHSSTAAIPIALFGSSFISSNACEFLKSNMTGPPFLMENSSGNYRFTFNRCKFSTTGGGQGYINASDSTFNQCIFTAGVAQTTVMIGWDSGNSYSAQNINIMDCEFRNQWVYLCSSASARFDNNQFVGIYQYNKMVLQPRVYGEPLNISVVGNEFNYSVTPPAGTYALSYDTTFASYNVTDGTQNGSSVLYLFGSFVVGNNVANVAGAMAGYSLFVNGGTHYDNGRIRFAKTFGNGRFLVRNTATNYDLIQDDYIGNSPSDAHPIIGNINIDSSTLARTNIFLGAFYTGYPVLQHNSLGVSDTITGSFQISTSSRLP